MIGILVFENSLTSGAGNVLVSGPERRFPNRRLTLIRTTNPFTQTLCFSLSISPLFSVPNSAIPCVLNIYAKSRPPFTVHSSLFTLPRSLFPVHCSLFTVHSQVLLDSFGTHVN